MSRLVRVWLVTSGIVGSVVAAACGMKGPPLPPIVILPERVSTLQAERLDRRVVIRFTVPATNSDRSRPADLDRLEMYALTTDPEVGPAPPADLEDWLDAATLVATFEVQDPAASDVAPSDAADDMERVAQGEAVTWLEPLTPGVLVPFGWEDAAAGRDGDDDDDTEPTEDGPRRARPFVAPPVPEQPRRTYLVRGVSSRGRESAPSERVVVSLGEASPAPGPPSVTYNESGILVEWAPAEGARLPVQSMADGDLLPSSPIVPFPPPSTYLVYSVSTTLPSRPVMPQPLNASAASGPTGARASQRRGSPAAGDSSAAQPEQVAPPAVETSWGQASLTFGRERCYAIRTLTMVDGLPVVGPASPATCVVPVDTFAPQAPRGLVAVAGEGAISLMWEPAPEQDVVGYRVLRRMAAGATLLPLTEEVVRGTSYRDATVTRGERYVYAVQAVDSALPANVSPASVEVTEQAR